MTTELTIIKPENIQIIVQSAPQSYQDNKLSRDKCNEAGQAILAAIQSQGMTDELDAQAAIYIEKARKTVKKMNERRSPITKLFDDIRKEFTLMENDIDPTKTDTIPYKLQQLRNQYAAKKRAEEEARRRAEMERLQLEAARNKMRQDIEDDLKQQFYALINKQCNELTNLDNSVTLDNYDTVYNTVKDWDCTLPSDYLTNLHTAIRIPVGITIDEIRRVEDDIKLQSGNHFAEQYEFTVGNARNYFLDRLPSKRTNLERMAQATAEDAARIKAEMEARQKAELARQQAEEEKRKEEERQKAELARQQAEMSTLFAQQAAETTRTKIKVTKKIELLNPEGILPILSMWWSKEGSMQSVDELAKIFKKQITFCEKLAKDDIYIEDENICYIDDVKAK